ncbi:TonB-dependent siderophore receptor [Caulobacter mirabilis]|uniref:TonB-dependent siderophore receptor n=1 Tax=Caulobacter mirabilis TaxID=69666 RepID=A0A2D2AVE3_9CAUL|nr:TonB-dependent siderophore receptor [Caulobacter mirabilis]ATQ41974.1 TonB-dependent siderophore receptor [Caulobacter mirabilis]
MSARAALLATTLLTLAPLSAFAAEADDDQPTSVSAVEIEGHRQKETPSATGLVLTLRETPQSVTQIQRQQIDDFALNTVNDLLTMAPGVNVEKVETDRTYFNARGFDITNFQVDGVGLPLIWGLQFGDVDTVIYDRVDIIRGANGMLTGTGNPSATINYIRKRPTREARGSLSASYGSWNAYRLTADLSGPLDSTGSVTGRLVYANEDRDSYLDHYHVNRHVFYGVLSWDVSSDLNVSGGAWRQDNQANGVLWGALPLTYANGARIPYDRSASTSADWTYWDTLDQGWFLEGTYQLGGGWQVKGTYTHKRFTEEAKLLYAYGNPDPVTGLGVAGMSGIYPSKYRQDLVDLTLTGAVSLFGRSHDVVLGVASAKGRGLEWENSGAGVIVYPAVGDWKRIQPAQPAYAGAYLAAQSEDRLDRLFGAIHLNLSDRLKGVVGFNAMKLESEGVSYGTGQARDESKVSPYVGVVYDLTPNLSLYASYTDIFNPQSEVDINRKTLDPAAGKSWEAGVKSEWFAGRLYATAAVFKSDQKGLALAAGTIPGSNDTYYVGQDTFVEGYELEVAGAITDRWRISGGWTQLSVEDKDGADARLYLPRKTLKLSTTYDVPELRNLKLGASVRWQSEISTMEQVRVEQDAYAVVDAMASIDVTPSVKATLNVRNLFDETYMTSLMWNQSYFAAPRSASVTLEYRF